MKLTIKEKQTIKIARYISKFDGAFECSELTYLIGCLLKKELRTKTLEYVSVRNDAGFFPIRIVIHKTKDGNLI